MMIYGLRQVKPNHRTDSYPSIRDSPVVPGTAKYLTDRRDRQLLARSAEG